MTAEQGFYPVAQIAAALNLKPRRIQQLAAAGIIPRAERGRYNLAESIAGYVRYLQDQIERSAPSDLDQHRMGLLAERHRGLDYANDVKEASLIPLAEARIVLEMVIDAFAAANKALLRRKLLGELAGMKEPALIRDRLKDEIHAIRTAAAQRMEAFAKANARQH